MSHIGCDTSWCIVAYHWLKRIYRYKDNIFLHSMVLLKWEFAVWVEIIWFLEKSSSFFFFFSVYEVRIRLYEALLIDGIANPQNIKEVRTFFNAGFQCPDDRDLSQHLRRQQGGARRIRKLQARHQNFPSRKRQEVHPSQHQGYVHHLLTLLCHGPG